MFGLMFRATHDRAVADLTASLAASDAKYDGLKIIADGLREDLREAHRQAHELRMAGAVTVPLPRRLEDAPSTVQDLHEVAALKALIATKCGTDTKRRGLMLKQLAADLAAGRAFEDIEADIEHGVETTGVPA